MTIAGVPLFVITCIATGMISLAFLLLPRDLPRLEVRTGILAAALFVWVAHLVPLSPAMVIPEPFRTPLGGLLPLILLLPAAGHVLLGLTRSEPWLRKALDSAVDGILIVDSKGRILFMNAAAEALLGGRRRRFMDYPFGIRLSEGNLMELEVPKPEGGPRVVEMRTVSIRWKGSPARLGSLHDVTERKAYEEEKVRLQKMDVVARLSGGITHDFSNILTAVQGFCDRIRRSPERTPAIEEAAREISAAAERGARITRKLLSLSGSVPPDPQVFKVNRMLSEMEKAIEEELGPEILLKLTLDEKETAIRADREQVEEALWNLIRNAREAMPDGGTLTVETAGIQIEEKTPHRPPDLPPGRYARISVIDRGAGMSEYVMNRIFDPFFTTKKKRGSGLGLTVTYGLVRANGGWITVRSRSGFGTLVDLYFPAVEVPAQPEKPCRKPVEKAPETGWVLLSDGDEAVRKLVGRHLEGMGFRVVAAADGVTALRLFKAAEEPPRLLVTDLVLPGKGGLEVYERLRRSVPGLRALFISGAGEAEQIARIRSFPGTAMLGKPFSMDLLEGKVRELLEDRSVNDDSRPGPSKKVFEGS